MTKKYIGSKMVTAWEEMATNEETGCWVSGYAVKYEDGYISWSPKEVFEKAYMEVGDNNTITQEAVDNFIKDYEVFTKKDKITIVIATLANGFTIVESSACVDPINYDEKIGADICKDRIKDRVWNYLGFLLQTAKDGIK